jgi:predicted Rossmann-fold nucleotide-binding protein
LFELLTLAQTGKTPAMPIVLVDEAYWRAIVDWDALVEGGMIGAEDRALIAFAADAADAWGRLKAAGIGAAGGRPAPAEGPAGNLPLGEGPKSS